MSTTRRLKKMSSTRSRKRASPVVSGGGGHDYNIALLGADGVGKSAITVKFISRRFISEYDSQLEDIYMKEEPVDRLDCTIRVMDTSEKVTLSSERYLQWADGFVVVYSICNRQTLSRARFYLEQINTYEQAEAAITGTPTLLPIILVANKLDMERYRQVQRSEGLALAKEFKCCHHYEMSAAKDYEGIRVIFQELVRQIKIVIDKHTPLNSLYITEEEKEKSTPSSAPDTWTTGSLPAHGAKTPPTSNSLDRNARLRCSSSSGKTNQPNRKSTSSFRFLNKIFS